MGRADRSPGATSRRVVFGVDGAAGVMHETTWKSRAARGLALMALLGLLTGCAAQRSFTRAQRSMERENYDQAVLEMSKAVALDPGNERFAVALERAKLKSSAEHFEKGKRYHDAGQLELAVKEYQATLMLNPGNQHAETQMGKALRELQRSQEGPSDIERIKEEIRRRDSGAPKLDPSIDIPILLNFQEQEGGKIFEALGKAAGINFIFDEKVDLEKPLTIDVGNVTMEKALDILMLQTKNFFKVIDDYTLLVAPDTRQKRQEYEDKVIRTFFLSNAETKTVVTLLRSLLQSRQIAENPELNSITLNDTPAKVAIADRIITANDKAKGEVLIDVELLEINRTLAQTLGIDLSSKSLSLTFREGMASLPLNDLDSLKQRGSWTVGVVPSVILNFLRSDSEGRSIAKPQLRVSEGERAEILIGDRIPIPTVSFNTSQTVGGNIVPITNFTYQNVGITVQIEPRVHHNREVTLNVQVEVSQVTGSVNQGGQEQPIIGTRQIQTVIRLRDGETNLLAGLIQQQRTDGRSGIPGLMDLPGIGKIVSNNSASNNETDIIMTLTPRIIRIPDITEQDLEPLWVGTEENMQLRGAARDALDQGPFRRSGSSVITPTAAGGAPAGVVGDGDTAAGEAGDDGGAAGVRSTAADDEQTDPERNRPASTPADDEPELDELDEVDEPIDDERPEPEPPAGPALVQLVPAKATYAVGETVVLQIIVSNASNVGSIPFHLRYNKDALQFLSPGLEGPFMQSDGTSTVFLASDTGGGGEIVVGMSRMGAGRGATGSGVLATLQFLAINPGPCNFQFTGASVKDPQARNLPAAFNTAQVEIAP